MIIIAVRQLLSMGICGIAMTLEGYRICDNKSREVYRFSWERGTAGKKEAGTFWILILIWYSIIIQDIAFWKKIGLTGG